MLVDASWPPPDSEPEKTPKPGNSCRIFAVYDQSPELSLSPMMRGSSIARRTVSSSKWTFVSAGML